MEILIRYPWPGNVRELRNLVERFGHRVPPGTQSSRIIFRPKLFRGAAESPHHPYSTLHEARSAYEREFILRKTAGAPLEHDANGPPLWGWNAATSTAK